MNNKELQATRKLLMLDASEAAELIGNVSVRSWQYWESGERPVPKDVANEMHALLAIRVEMLGVIDDKLTAGDSVELPFYASFEQFEADNPGKNKVDWRLSQSVAALYYTEGHAALV